MFGVMARGMEDLNVMWCPVYNSLGVLTEGTGRKGLAQSAKEPGIVSCLFLR